MSSPTKKNLINSVPNFLIIAAIFCNCIQLIAGVKSRSTADSLLLRPAIAHTHLKIDFTQIHTGQISAEAHIMIDVQKPWPFQYGLDLLQFKIDSITVKGKKLPYVYNDTILKLSFDKTNLLDSHNWQRVKIYYRGTPQADASGWGGFYIKENGYAFNLGVGFSAKPHPFGRAWFPCIDAYNAKSSYSFELITPDTLAATANGEQTQVTVRDNHTKVWKYEMMQAIPSYLVGVAMGPFQFYEKKLFGIKRQIPLRIAAPADKMPLIDSSFQNLERCLQIFETNFGPYPFSNIAFTLVPFNGGAMEHAANISYPLYAVDGSTKIETLYAHEFAHSWFGNYVTCLSATDMWWNEGFASFAEMLFLEKTYGREKMLAELFEKQSNVLERAHIADGAYAAVAHPRHNTVYGMHTYQKGAMVAYNLKTYMGDSAFYASIRQVFVNHSFKNISVEQLVQELQQYSGKNLQAFYTDWLDKPGFPIFFPTVLAKKKSRKKSKETTIIISQMVVGRKQKFSQVPLSVSFYSATGNAFVANIQYDSLKSIYNFSLPFAPVYVACNVSATLADGFPQQTIVSRSKNTSPFLYNHASIALGPDTSKPAIVTVGLLYQMPFMVNFDGRMLANPTFVNAFNAKNIQKLELSFELKKETDMQLRDKFKIIVCNPNIGTWHYVSNALYMPVSAGTNKKLVKFQLQHPENGIYLLVNC